MLGSSQSVTIIIILNIYFHLVFLLLRGLVRGFDSSQNWIGPREINEGVEFVDISEF